MASRLSIARAIEDWRRTRISFGVRFGWRKLLAGSGLVWLAAQLGGRELLHSAVIRVTHLHIPLQETGAFNLLAWQAVWMMGLWLGAKSAEGDVPLKRLPNWTVALSTGACLFFVGVRHNLLGPKLTQSTLAFWLDKWHIGPLRVLNLVAFTIVFYWLRRIVFPIVAVEPFLTLGKASLEVFCAHIIFVFIGLALLYNDVAQLHGVTAIVLLTVTFTGLFLLAANEVRKRTRDKLQAQGKRAPLAKNAAPSGETMLRVEQPSVLATSSLATSSTFRDTSLIDAPATSYPTTLSS